MRILTLLFSVTCALAASNSDYYLSNLNQPCYGFTKNVTFDYRRSISNFVMMTYKASIGLSNYNYVFSPYSLWMILAAIAEGSTFDTQQQLFRILDLPNEVCIRQLYYRLATTRIAPGQDIEISSTRGLAVDDSCRINPQWYEFVKKNDLIDVMSAPIKRNPELAMEQIKHEISAQLPNINLNGNAVIIDAMDFSGLWDTGFSTIQREPFYDINREHIGYVDMMRTRRRVRMGYIASTQTKVLELPMGADSRYLMLAGIIVGDVSIPDALKSLSGSHLIDSLEVMRESSVPLEIGIPQYTMTSEIDVRKVFESLGVKDLWIEPSVTRAISDPAILPSSFAQRVTISLNRTGIKSSASTRYLHSADTGLDPRVGTDFIANKPFFWVLMDTEIYSCLLVSAYTVPTYPL